MTSQQHCWASRQHKFEISCIHKPKPIKGKDIKWLSRETHPLWGLTVPAMLFGVFRLMLCVCLTDSFVAGLLINTKGPAAILYGVRHCWGLIWLHSGPSVFQICAALSADRCLAEPFNQLAFYLKAKADLDVIALTVPISPSLRLSLSPVLVCPSICRFVCHFCLSLSFSFVFISLPSSVFPITHLASFVPSSVYPFTHTLPHLISAASVQHICLVRGVKIAWT